MTEVEAHVFEAIPAERRKELELENPEQLSDVLKNMFERKVIEHCL